MVEIMSEDILGYSSHDWRKNTDSAIVIDDKNKRVDRINYLISKFELIIPLAQIISSVLFVNSSFSFEKFK